MGVIKSNHASTLLREAIVLDLGDLGKQAERLKQAARTKAQRIISDAQRQAQQRVADARDMGFEQGQAEGFQKGYQDGLAEGRTEALAQAGEQLAQVEAMWRQSAGELEAMRERIQRQAGHAVLKLALGMAEKLVHRVVEVDQTVIVDQLAAALSHVLKPVDVTVRINPDDRTILEQAMPQLLADFAHFRHIRLVDDATLSAGGCVVNHGQGRIDASLEKQLERVIETMLPAGMVVADDPQPDDALDETPEMLLDSAVESVSSLTQELVEDSYDDPPSQNENQE